MQLTEAIRAGKGSVRNSLTERQEELLGEWDDLKEQRDRLKFEINQEQNSKFANGGAVEDLKKELHRLQRQLNSPRLATYIEGDNSKEEKARQTERAGKLARFNEVLNLLREKDGKYSRGGEIVRNPAQNSWSDFFAFFQKHNQTPVSKGNLMKMAYGNTFNVDSAIPQSLWSEVDNTSFFVYDYQQNSLGELVDLREKLKWSNNVVDVTIVTDEGVLYGTLLPEKLQHPTFHQALSYVFNHAEVDAFDIRPKSEKYARGGTVYTEGEWVVFYGEKCFPDPTNKHKVFKTGRAAAAGMKKLWKEARGNSIKCLESMTLEAAIADGYMPSNEKYGRGGIVHTGGDKGSVKEVEKIAFMAHSEDADRSTFRGTYDQCVDKVHEFFLSYGFEIREGRPFDEGNDDGKAGGFVVFTQVATSNGKVAGFVHSDGDGPVAYIR